MRILEHYFLLLQNSLRSCGILDYSFIPLYKQHYLLSITYYLFAIIHFTLVICVFAGYLGGNYVGTLQI